MLVIGENLTQIEKVNLLSLIMEKKNDEYRLCQICCSFVDETYEITYSFAKDYELENYRLVVAREEEVPSISRVYKSATYYENEMKELWGLNVAHMKVDFDNNLYSIDATAPFVPAKEDTANA